MSQSPLSSLGSSSQASSRSSPQAPHSDTTPSPSGGNKSPLFDPHHLVGKLAFLEASESLAHAAETLSLAAKAMSKAAASFAVASGYKDYSYIRTPHHYGGELTNVRASLEGTESPEWQQNSYALPALMHTNAENESLGGIRPQHNASHENTNPDFLDSVESAVSATNATDPGKIPVFTGHYDLQPVECPTPTTAPDYQPIIGPIPGASSISCTTTAGVVPSDSVNKTLLDEQQAHEHPKEHLDDSDMRPDNQLGTPLEPENEVIAPITKPEGESSLSIPKRLSQRIVLDSGFDQLPVICALAKQNSKTICLCKYWGFTPSIIEAILKKSVPQTVVYPPATKLASLQIAAQRFASLPSGILLWPASKALPEVPGSAILLGAHVIHLGEPAKETAGCGGPNVAVVIAQKELDEMPTSDRNKLVKEYPLAHDNESYNQLGSGSPLHLARTHARARLSKAPSARGLYLAWLESQRRDHPEWAAEELVKRANDYAEEFLLRGEPKTDRFIGGKVPLTPLEIKSMRLESAVKAGILAVA